MITSDVHNVRDFINTRTRKGSSDLSPLVRISLDNSTKSVTLPSKYKFTYSFEYTITSEIIRHLIKEGYDTI